MRLPTSARWVGAAIGLAAGYLYASRVGCTSHCGLLQHPWLTALIGAFVGYGLLEGRPEGGRAGEPPEGPPPGQAGDRESSS